MKKFSTTADEVQRAFGYLFAAELNELKRLAVSLPDNPTVINIGAGAGTSGLAFMESRGDIRLCTIDITDESSPYGCLEAERDLFRRANFPTAGQDWVQINGDSSKVPWDGDKVDMVFVDGGHSYKECAADIDAWLPRIKNGGIISVHDFDKDAVFSLGLENEGKAPSPRAWPGVDRAVKEKLLPIYDTVSVVMTLISFRVTDNE